MPQQASGSGKALQSIVPAQPNQVRSSLDQQVMQNVKKLEKQRLAQVDSQTDDQRGTRGHRAQNRNASIQPSDAKTIEARGKSHAAVQQQQTDASNGSGLKDAHASNKEKQERQGGLAAP